MLTELDHLVYRHHGFPDALAVLESLTDRIADGDYRLATISNDDFIAARNVRLAYASLELDLADAVGVVLADRFETDQIFTLDQRDFRAIKPLTARFDHFRIVPADL